jgi:hypothetical protein
MKDYRDEIQSILISNLQLNGSFTEGKSLIPGISGVPEAINVINALIKHEIFRLEQYLVVLSDELAEANLLLMEANNVSIPVSRMKFKPHRDRKNSPEKLRRRKVNS